MKIPKEKKLVMAEEQKSHEMDLNLDMMVQKATQAVTNRYEMKIKQLTRFHEKEMQTLIEGRKTFVKPSFWSRFNKRFKDIYILYNHRMPVYCHRSDCETASSGVNWGIEYISTDLEKIMEAADEYFYEWRNYPDHTSMKILHLQVDRRSRKGAIVKDVTMSYTDWNPETKQLTKDKLEKVTADSAIVDSLVKNRPGY